MDSSKLEEVLRENPTYRILSKTKLKQVLSSHGIPKKDVDAYLKGDELHQVYAKLKYRPNFKIASEPYSFQIDVIDHPRYKSYNNGIGKFFLAIEVNSRKAFAYPMKRARMQDVIVVYKKFLQEVDDEQICNVTGDDFFDHSDFRLLNDELMIKTHSDIAKSDHITKVGDKLGILDRATRTIKQLIRKYMLDNDDLVWSKFLDKIITLYNDTPHSSLKGSTPNEVYDDYSFMMGLYQATRDHNRLENEKIDLDVGDTVRAMLGKEGFEKEKQRFSTKLFKVAEQVGYRFRLIDEDGKDVKRLYRPGELLKIEEVSRRVGGKLEKAEARQKQKSKQARVLRELA
jgi:hypothetical protein